MPYNFREREDIEAVLRLIEDPPKKPPKGQQGPEDWGEFTPGGIFKTPSEGINARNGTTCGTSECTPFAINSSGELVELTNPDGSARTSKVFNIFSGAIAGTEYITAKLVHGRWIADAENCT